MSNKSNPKSCWDSLSETESDLENLSSIADKQKKKKDSNKHMTRICWLCFKQGTLVTCSNVSCKRSYHRRCVIKRQYVGKDNNRTCPVCQIVKEAEKIENGKPRFDKNFVQILLKMWLQRLKDFVLIFDTHESFDQRMSIKTLEAKVEALEYKSLEAFYSDITWIFFYCHVLSDKEQYLRKENFCFDELRRINGCFECYYKSNIGMNDDFTEVCFTPHILLWAKVKGSVFWPAKVFSVDAEEEKVLVTFFGSHENTYVQFSNCYLFSREYPSKKSVDAELFWVAMKEIRKHIEKLRETFNGFEYAPLRVPYDPTLNNEYLKMMLPNIGFYERTNSTSKLVEALLEGRKPKMILPQVKVEKLCFSENVKKRRLTIDLKELPDICAKKKKLKVEDPEPEVKKINKNLNKPKIIEKEDLNNNEKENKEKPLEKPIVVEIIEGKAKKLKEAENTKIFENFNKSETDEIFMEKTKNIEKIENEDLQEISNKSAVEDDQKKKNIEKSQNKCISCESKNSSKNYESHLFNDHCYAMNSISFEEHNFIHGNNGGFSRLALLIDNLTRFAVSNRELQSQMLNMQQEHAKEVKKLKEIAEQEKFLEIKDYELELDYCEKKYQKEISDLKKKSELLLSDTKKHEAERVAEIIRQLQLKHEAEKQEAVEKAIANTKLQIWCASCQNEAKFQCCYSTWYCKPSCQTKDRQRHKKFCRARLPQKFLPKVLNID
ncbi:zinc finger MYND domain-containing protein 11-like [Culicoides brevitarsis]|uniref:zinc finger MYND domain-containing protein 11-like n=1 Tax=Culicoides brevitarsis TaxID=469753 RepID=UPI00307C13B2